jgi:hypothetical protein
MAPDTVEGRRLVIRLACLPLGAVLALGLVSAGGVSSATWQAEDSRTGAVTRSIAESADCVEGASGERGR